MNTAIKTTIRNTLFAAASLLMLASASQAMAGESFDYKGFGGYRTTSAFGHDRGYAKYNTCVEYCKQICVADKECKGIEYVSNPNGWHENGQHVTNKCEIHHDDLSHCDTSGGTKTTYGQDGCHVIKRSHCPANNWGWISLGTNGLPEIHPVATSGIVAATDVAVEGSDNRVFEVAHIYDNCTITLKSRQNNKFATNIVGNLYASEADEGKASRYKVQTNSDGTYSFMDTGNQRWVFVGGNSYVYAQALDTNDPMSHFNVKVHDPRR